VQTVDAVRRGREAHAARRWAAAIDALSAADGERPLGPDDLELLASALFLVGREENYFAILERAHDAHLEAGATVRAASCALWIGTQLFMRGEVGRGEGWLGRAQRLLDDDGRDCVERGYLLMPEFHRMLARGDLEAAVATAETAIEVGRRFEDADLQALAAHALGRGLIEADRVGEGLTLLDEAMLAVRAGALSPIPTGIVYCGAIDGCHLAFDPRRAAEWTAALHAWCELQPDLLAFTGDCHVHRCEIMELHGAWSDALEELDRAAQRAERAGNPRVAADAAYRRGEILRLRGEPAAAQVAYREASRGGREPQPGLALLRLATGDTVAAMAAVRRALEERAGPGERATLLPAYIEIALGAGEVEAAREACCELEAIANETKSELLAASAAHMRGAVELADADARAALPYLRRAVARWHELGAPYETARVRLLLSEACVALGDDDSAGLERDAAQEALAALGATRREARQGDLHGLTDRELEVLRLVATGQTNRAIADELVLSERTIDRHVSNILAKLRVSSRAAATAFAYEHGLL
jgi:DNA-binding CsgD family transcriptional regulator